jgi:hypothetical protein
LLFLHIHIFNGVIIFSSAGTAQPFVPPQPEFVTTLYNRKPEVLKEYFEFETLVYRYNLRARRTKRMKCQSFNKFCTFIFYFSKVPASAVMNLCKTIDFMLFAEALAS